MEEQAKYERVSKQMVLFEKDPEPVKLCSICHQNPMSKNGKGILWNGFRDRDMNVLVCFKEACIKEHYRRKGETEHKSKFAEFPEPYTFK